MHKTLVTTKNFVVRNRALIAVTATAVIVIQQQGIRLHVEFLKDKDLYTEFLAQTID